MAGTWSNAGLARILKSPASKVRVTGRERGRASRNSERSWRSAGKYEDPIKYSSVKDGWDNLAIRIRERVGVSILVRIIEELVESIALWVDYSAG